MLTRAVDNFKGAYEATGHLIKNGYKRIPTIANSEFLSITTERLAGYKEALQDNGFKFNKAYVKHCFYGGIVFSEIEDAVNKLFILKQKPDPILATSDKLSNGCLKTLIRRGLSILGDIGLAGFSNSDIAELLSPYLTVVRQPAMEMGRAATELLLQLIEKKRPVVNFEKRVMSPELFIGKSSAPQ